MACRASMFALAMHVVATVAVHAHALPDSLPLLRQEGSALILIFEVAKEDLIVAAADLNTLKQEKPNEPLSQQMAE
ncbi:MAG: hypothetical protein V7661_02195 [Sulfitobacter sp.]